MDGVPYEALFVPAEHNGSENDYIVFFAGGATTDFLHGLGIEAESIYRGAFMLDGTYIFVGATLLPDQVRAARAQRIVRYVQQDEADRPAPILRPWLSVGYTPELVENSYFVNVCEDVAPGTVAARYGIQNADTFTVIHAFCATMEPNVREAVRRDPDALWLEQNSMVSADA